MSTPINNEHLIVPSDQPGDDDKENYNRSPNPPRAGNTCPRCGSARLDYNGLLHLICPNCGVIEVGTST